MKNKHEEILRELFEEFKYNPILECDDNPLELEMYIRTKYLLGNKENIEYFAEYYDVEHPDEISSCMIRELKTLNTLQKCLDSLK